MKYICKTYFKDCDDMMPQWKETQKSPLGWKSMEKSVPQKDLKKEEFLQENYFAEQARMISRQYEVSMLIAFQMISETIIKQYIEKYCFP